MILFQRYADHTFFQCFNHSIFSVKYSPHRRNVSKNIICYCLVDRRLLGMFYYEGKEYDFNFSKLHLMVKTTFAFEEHDEEVVWHVRQENIMQQWKLRCTV